ncbi:MAG: hypothetical protein K2X78_15070 [Burkholderiaceae bacterium]|nr:hypothetical protein [Burkholderiaceae bacterium]
MRGLDIRVMLAQARITAFVDSAQAEGMYYNVVDEAFTQGMQDARSGMAQLPLLFKDEQMLESSWRRGYEFELESIEMRACWNCNNGTGDPCPTHG